MAVLYLDVFDSKSYEILEKALELEGSWHDEFDIVPIFNGSFQGYLPLLALAWMQRAAPGTDCLFLLTLLGKSAPSVYGLDHILSSIRACGGGYEREIREQLINDDNVNHLSDLLARSELLEIKALTMTEEGGRIFIGYSEVEVHLNKELRRANAWID